MGHAPPLEAPAAGSEAGQRLLLSQNYPPPGLQRRLATAALFKPHAQTDLGSKAGRVSWEGWRGPGPSLRPSAPHDTPQSPQESVCSRGPQSGRRPGPVHVQKGAAPGTPLAVGTRPGCEDAAAHRRASRTTACRSGPWTSSTPGQTSPWPTARETGLRSGSHAHGKVRIVLPGALGPCEQGLSHRAVCG